MVVGMVGFGSTYVNARVVFLVFQGSKSRNKDILASGLTVQEVMDKLRKEME